MWPDISSLSGSERQDHADSTLSDPQQRGLGDPFEGAHMFGLGTQELLIILVLVMVIFGAGKLPQVGSALGKGIRNFKAGMNEEDKKEEAEVVARVQEK
jgi:sec-independent protein translocase protein TatA